MNLGVDIKHDGIWVLIFVSRIEREKVNMSYRFGNIRAAKAQSQKVVRPFPQATCLKRNCSIVPVLGGDV